MRIAIPYDNGCIFQHFGRTERFKIYDAENGTVTESQILASPSGGHGALGLYLAALRVNAVICGGIGGGAMMALSDADIDVFAGIEGDADEAAAALLAGTLHMSGEATCGCHGEHHHHDHDCGCHEHHHHDHDCGCHEHHHDHDHDCGCHEHRHH